MGYSSAMFIKILVLCWALLALLISGDDKAPSRSPLVIAQHCTEKCGSVSIPYPFGLEDGCYLEENDPSLFSYYKIDCNYTATPPVPIFGSNLEVLNISLGGDLVINRYISFDCYDTQNRSSVRARTTHQYNDFVFTGRFTISGTHNVLIATGCDTFVWFSGRRHERWFDTGCMTSCNYLDDVADGACNGIGCCQASLPEGVTNISTLIGTFWNHSNASFNPCSAAFPVAIDKFSFKKSNITQKLDYYLSYPKLPIVLNWAVGTEDCSVAKASGSCLCKDNAFCEDLQNQVGYRCKCKDGFTGNPYLPHGCTDIDECKKLTNDCEKAEYCVNKNGGYDCKCPKGYHGNGTITHPCISDKEAWLIPVLATAGVGGSIIALLVIGFVVQWMHGKRKLREMRESYFRQNGGLLLHEKLSNREVDTLKIFSAQDLEMASNNYSSEKIIGRGGFGVVYKGILPNRQVVAIKKSLKVDPNQVEQFINEILVLSQIKNKYVVKLVGCCLESEVPLLVYEFINNGTLYDHLNDEVKASILSWHLRLKIASQVANVLSYLHYTISTPIIHRDMKSMNILLDESYTAKVADFGASRLVPPDQDQLTTMVQGTRGYLDPEYLQTNELTQKSDVYSFGVVLVELLTRKKALSNERSDIEKCLAMHFLLKMKDGCLFNIIDKKIMNEGTIEDIERVANLAKCCLMLKGEERPTMKEVATELETIGGKGMHPWYNDGSFEEDHESLLAKVPRLNDAGCSSSVVELSSVLLSSLENGR